MTEATREPLVGLAERLRGRMERWTGNGDDAWMNVKLGEVRALFTALEEQSRGRLQDDMQLWRTAATWAVTFQAVHGRPPSVDDATEAARTALSPSDTVEKGKGEGA